MYKNIVVCSHKNQLLSINCEEAFEIKFNLVIKNNNKSMLIKMYTEKDTKIFKSEWYLTDLNFNKKVIISLGDNYVFDEPHKVKEVLNQDSKVALNLINNALSKVKAQKNNEIVVGFNSDIEVELDGANIIKESYELSDLISIQLSLFKNKSCINLKEIGENKHDDISFNDISFVNNICFYNH